MRRRYHEQEWSREPDLSALREARKMLKRDGTRALADLQALADRGSLMSMVCLGEAFERAAQAAADLRYPSSSAEDGAVDLQLTERWYARAANEGSIIARYALGRFYLKIGRLEDGRSVMAIAAAAEFPPALAMMGRMYWFGIGGNRDQDRAIQYLDRAVARGHIPARVLLRHIHLKTSSGILIRLWGCWQLVRVFTDFLYVLLTKGVASVRLLY